MLFDPTAKQQGSFMPQIRPGRHPVYPSFTPSADDTTPRSVAASTTGPPSLATAGVEDAPAVARLGTDEPDLLPHPQRRPPCTFTASSRRSPRPCTPARSWTCRG